MTIRTTLSQDAKSLISQLFTGCDISSVETLEHDGYDEDGPESDLWTLHIFEKKEQNDYILHIFHWENWFCHGGNHSNQYIFTEYEDWSKHNFSKLVEEKRWHQYFNIAKATNNEELINIYKILNDKN